MTDHKNKQASADKPAPVRRLWLWFWGLATGTAGIAFVPGIVFWGGFNTAMEATNTEQFCVSCPEMRDNVFVEYRTPCTTRTAPACVPPARTAMCRRNGCRRSSARSRRATSSGT